MDYWFGKLGEERFSTTIKLSEQHFVWSVIEALSANCLSSPSNMPHFINFIPALFFISVLKLFISHRQSSLSFFQLHPPMTSSSYCESTSTPEALNSHQALLHLSLHYCYHLKRVPFLCFSVTSTPSLLQLSSPKRLLALWSLSSGSPYVSMGLPIAPFADVFSAVPVLIWGSLEPKGGIYSTIDHYPSLSLSW